MASHPPSPAKPESRRTDQSRGQTNKSTRAAVMARARVSIARGTANAIGPPQSPAGACLSRRASSRGRGRAHRGAQAPGSPASPALRRSSRRSRCGPRASLARAHVRAQWGNGRQGRARLVHAQEPADRTMSSNRRSAGRNWMLVLLPGRAVAGAPAPRRELCGFEDGRPRGRRRPFPLRALAR